jgi:hypothetical protein
MSGKNQVIISTGFEDAETLAKIARDRGYGVHFTDYPVPRDFAVEINGKVAYYEDPLDEGILVW